jgi:hypothetical protein
VSSNCSTDTRAGAPTVAAQLTSALDILESDVRTAHAEMARRLGERRVRISVDEETFDVAPLRGRLRVSEPEGDASVTIETSRALMREVLSGECPLEQALRNDSLRARGTLRDLVAVLSALEAFVHGAVRCGAAMPKLFDQFQTEKVA